MTESLSLQNCEACQADAPKVSEQELPILLAQIPDWSAKSREGILMLERAYTFKNYKQAWAFANKVSELAEQEFHHPAILLEWGKVVVTWWSHSIKGLHRNDFICAAKTDRLL